MKFEIKNRWSGDVQRTCELDAEFAGKSYGLQLGAAVKLGYKSGADLRDADLRGADLRHIQVDFFDVLLRASTNGEVPGLIAALKEGRVDGSTYTGQCACLVGTIANVKGCEYTSIPDLAPDSSRPIEQFFYSIRKGDTPETNRVSAIVLEWAEDFQRLMARTKEVHK